MMLEAVWFKNKKEVCRVDPVLNVLCDDEMEHLAEIEINNGHGWYSCADFDADDFVIRVKRG